MTRYKMSELRSDCGIKMPCRTKGFWRGGTVECNITTFGGRVNAASILIHWRFHFLVALPPSRDLLPSAKHQFVAARTIGCSHDAVSATGSASAGSAITLSAVMPHHVPTLYGAALTTLVCRPSQPRY